MSRLAPYASAGISSDHPTVRERVDTHFGIPSSARGDVGPIMYENMAQDTIVFMSSTANFDGYTPEMKAQALELTADAIPPMLREAYEAPSPDGPEHFETVSDKLAHTWKTEPTHELAELERVSAPTLVILGDDDVLTIEHAASIQRAIPDSQLAVVPGTDHLLLFEKPEVVNRLILDFLADEQAPKLFSERHDEGGE